MTVGRRGCDRWNLFNGENAFEPDHGEEDRGVGHKLDEDNLKALQHPPFVDLDGALHMEFTILFLAEMHDG